MNVQPEYIEIPYWERKRITFAADFSEQCSFVEKFVVDLETYEGAWDSFEGLFGGHTYTHHPLELIWEMRQKRAFRHLSLPQLCDAVKECGCVRKNPSPLLGFDPLARSLRWIICNQVDPKETKKEIAKRFGTSCLFCDRMAWKGYNDEYGLMTDEYGLMTKATRQIYGWAKQKSNNLDGVLGYEYPLLCSSCARVNPMSYKQSKYRGLHTLLAFLQRDIRNAKKTKKTETDKFKGKVI